MSPEKVAEVCGSYFLQLNAKPLRDHSFPNVMHLAWMCQETIHMCQDGRIEKAMRWLGFIQGAMWVMGLTTVEDAKRANMPAGEEFKP